MTEANNIEISFTKYVMRFNLVTNVLGLLCHAGEDGSEFFDISVADAFNVYHLAGKSGGFLSQFYKFIDETSVAGVIDSVVN